MTAARLASEIALELAALEQVAQELAALVHDVASREPTVREKTAAAAFLAQFYSGLENILKRLSRFHGAELPSGENWHFELFKRFCQPGQPPLPVLFDDRLALQFGAFSGAFGTSSTTGTGSRSNGNICAKAWFK